jgi:aminopeptidase N
MLIKRKKLILLIIIPSILIAGIIFFYFYFKEQIELISQNEKHVGLVLDLKNIDDDFIAEYNVKEQQSFDVLHYSINIELFPKQKQIKGDVSITMKVMNPGQENLVLNFYDNLKISQLELNGAKTEFSCSETNLTIKPKKKFTDTSVVRILYEGEPKKLGFGSFNFDDVDGRPLIYSLNEPVFASTWFPCIDVPNDKALADIFITNDSSFVSLSNGKLMETFLTGNKKTYHWKTFYPISTYLIALYSGHYKTYSQKYISINRDTVPLYCYALPEKYDDAVKDFLDHPKYLKTFEELFGAYPFTKEKYSVAQFNWVYGAMEHQTITGVSTNYISGLKLFQDMIIHELAHHWWGNGVGPKTWKDIWLNEGFSTYSEALYWEKNRGFDALQTTLEAKFGTFNKGTLYSPDHSLFSSMVYDKGAWVLHMLRKEVGDSTFFKILRNYFIKFKYKNASTKDFQNIAEELAHKKLTYFFDQWIYKGEGIIEAEYTYNTESVANRFQTKIKIKQLQNGYDIYKFPIDIKIIFDNGSTSDKFYIDKKEQLILIETTSKPIKILLDPDNWLLAKFDYKNENE